jgi:hypothetical protein
MSGFRVVLDVDRIAADLCVAEERPVRASEVLELLKRIGFISVEKGRAWLATSDCMSMLRARIGVNANPFRSEVDGPATAVRPRSGDDFVEVEAAWAHLPPAKRQEILQTIRGS